MAIFQVFCLEKTRFLANKRSFSSFLRIFSYLCLKQWILLKVCNLIFEGETITTWLFRGIQKFSKLATCVISEKESSWRTNQILSSILRRLFEPSRHSTQLDTTKIKNYYFLPSLHLLFCRFISCWRKYDKQTSESF